MEVNLDVVSKFDVVPQLSFNNFSLNASLKALEYRIGLESDVKANDAYNKSS